MPQRAAQAIEDFNTYEAPPQAPQEPPSWGQTFEAGWRLESDVHAALDLMTRPTYEPDPTWKPVDWLKKNGYWEDYRDNFIGAKSEAEAQAIAGRIKQEQSDRETLQNAGWAGTAAAVTMGLLSPTMFLPFVGEARGLQAVGKGAALGLTAGALQEFPLAAAQETRTPGESIAALSASTVLGGILGGVAGTLTREHVAGLADGLKADMAYSRGERAIPAPVGAATARVDAGKFANSLGAIETFKRMSPVLRTVQQDTSPQARWMMAQMSDAGLTFERNATGVPTSAGGTVENLVKTWYGGYAKAAEAIDENYLAFVYDGAVPGFAPNLRAVARGSLGGGEKSKASFRQEISRAMRNGDQHENKHVAAAAQALRKEVYDPLLKAAQDAGIIPKEVETLGDPGYLFRDYNRRAIQANYKEFIDILAKHYETKLNDEFTKKLENFRAAQERDADLIEDIGKSPEEIEETKVQLGEHLQDLEEGANTQHLTALEDTIANLRSLAREIKGDSLAEQTLKKQYLADARDMERSGGEPLAALRKNTAAVRRRLRNLNKAQVVLEAKVARKLEKVEAAEENSLKTLKRLIKKASKFVKLLGTDQLEDKRKAVEYPDSDFPVIGYHGSTEVITAFDPAKTRLGRGVFFSEDPQLANMFAMGQATDGDPAFFPEDDGFLEAMGPLLAEEQKSQLAKNYAVFMEGPDAEGFQASYDALIDEAYRVAQMLDPDTLLPSASRAPNITKARLRLGKTYEVNLGDRFDWDKEAEAIEYARANGFDSVTFTISGSKGKEKFYSILNEKGIQPSLAQRKGKRKADTQDGELSDKAFDKQIEELKGLFAATAKQFDKGEERLHALAMNETDPTVGRLLGEEARQRQRADKLTAIAEELENAERLDRDDIRAIVEDGLQEVLTQAQGIVERRAVRSARLQEQAKALTPDELNKRIEDIRTGRADRQRELEDRIRTQGADYVDLTNGTADFARTAKEAAEKVAQKITGVHLRLPAFEVMQGERGAELARVLDIPSATIEKFLENDVELLTRSYLRTLAPDVEIARKFGTVNAEDQFRELIEEESEKLYNLKRDYLQKKQDKVRDKKKLSEDEIRSMEIKDPEFQRASLKLADEYKGYRRDLTAIMGRLRHTWGLPDNPDGLTYRAARTIMNLNVLRFMGGVTIASIPDVGRPIMKYGITRTFRDGFMPLITNFKGLKMSARELRLAGGALDVVLHSRAHAMFDIIDDLGRGSKFERGVEFATNRMGIWAGFDYWTSAMKQFTSSIAMGQIMDSLRLVVEKGDKKAAQYLAGLGIDAERARDMWTEVLTNDGGAKVNGVWMPNTESWKNMENVRAFRSALVREVDNAIVTPGVERPLWMNETMTGRLVSQFKGFTMSSTTKTLLAGMQQRDMAFMSGILSSLAFGALSYYIWARLSGGEAETKMLNAGLDKWADEAIDRSGMLGILSEAQHVFERIPATQGIASFSGGRSTRRGGDTLIEAMFGPSFDFLSTGANVLAGIDDPTQSTIHQLRTMAPLQNHIALRRILDNIEKASGLPESRR